MSEDGAGIVARLSIPHEINSIAWSGNKDLRLTVVTTTGYLYILPLDVLAACRE